jgi:signal transduction histidine kinase
VISAVAALATTPAAGIAVAALVAVVVLHRLLEATGPERRARVTAATAAGVFAFVLVLSAAVELRGLGTFAERGALWAYDLAVAGTTAALALDLLFGTWAQTTVTRLVVDLGRGVQHGTLRDRLAAALGDPSLVLGYWLPERAIYVDDGGEVVELPDEGASRSVTVVRDEDKPLAVLVHDAGSVDAELLESVAAAARLVVANARLQEDVRRQVTELEASRRRVVEAGDAQRRRLEAEIRGGVERTLAEAAMLLAETGRPAPTPEFAATLAETQGELARAREELRAFARGVHPRVLTEGGLAAALRELVSSSRMPVDLSVAEGRFPAPVEAAAYFVCAEALTNVAKHATARRVTIDVADGGGRLVAGVRDDGAGGARLDLGRGLRGLADRVEALGGRFTLASEAGAGTVVVAELPLR